MEGRRADSGVRGMIQRKFCWDLKHGIDIYILIHLTYIY